MRINHGFLAGGIFLLFVGAVPLALRAGYLTESQLNNVGSLWPLVLIGIGIGIVLARTRFAFLGGVVVAATFGLIVGGVLGGGLGGFGLNACGADGQRTSFAAREGPLTGTSASVELDLNCGDVTVLTAPGNAWRIEGEDRDGIGPNVSADDDSVTVRSRDSDRGPLSAIGDREKWRITLPDAVRLDLDMQLNAGSSTMNLGTASIDGFHLQMNAGSAVVDLGSLAALGDLQLGLNAGSLDLTLPNQSFRGSIHANAGSVNLCAPPGAALRLNTSESIVASYDFEDHGLVKAGSTWQTPGFESAEIRIELDTQANAGSFSLDPEEGCGG